MTNRPPHHTSSQHAPQPKLAALIAPFTQHNTISPSVSPHDTRYIASRAPGRPICDRQGHAQYATQRSAHLSSSPSHLPLLVSHRISSHPIPPHHRPAPRHVPSHIHSYNHTPAANSTLAFHYTRLHDLDDTGNKPPRLPVSPWTPETQRSRVTGLRGRATCNLCLHEREALCFRSARVCNIVDMYMYRDKESGYV